MDAAPPVPDELLVGYVRARDVPCPTCGYNLRDLATPTCPECGEGLVLRLGATTPRTALLVAGLAPILMSAGFCGILLLYLGFLAAFRGGPGLGPAEVVPLVLGLVALLPVARVWARRWHGLRRAPLVRRWGLLAMIWAWSIAPPLVFLSIVN
ncbi:MAG: hypothetical protein AAFX79_08635 [Planctomycetota bacterium]